MRLVPLFEGELRFDETTECGFPSYGEDGDWSGYVQGEGQVSGERLSGDLRWTNHPRRRADGTWLPKFDGVIRTGEPFEVSGKRSHESIAGSRLVLIEGGPHGVNVTHADQFNKALLEFLAS